MAAGTCVQEEAVSRSAIILADDNARTHQAHSASVVDSKETLMREQECKRKGEEWKNACLLNTRQDVQEESDSQEQREREREKG